MSQPTDLGHPSSSNSLSNLFFRFDSLFVIAFAALLHGTLYAVIVPPWQHYDEPSHFQRVWQVAQPSDPEAGDGAIRQAIAASMVENDFFRNLSIKPDLFAKEPDIWIGISQDQDPPLYYWLAAQPLRLPFFGELASQVRAVRLVSVVIFALVVLVSALTAREIWPPASKLRWALPFAILITPAFTDLMSAINNDVGAVLFFSLFLYAGTRLIMRGFSLKGATTILGASALCLLTKSTIWLAAPLGLVALLLSLHGLSQRVIRTLWLAAGLITLAALPIVFDRIEPAGWYKSTAAPLVSTVRSKNPNAVAGAYVMEFEPTPPQTPRSTVFQPLPASELDAIKGSQITVGAWMWSDEKLEARLPYVWLDGKTVIHTASIGPRPQFFSFSTRVPRETQSLYLVLQPHLSETPARSPVFIDAVILLRGEWPESMEPGFAGPLAANGTWNGAGFRNLARNASGEQTWITLRAGVNARLLETSPVHFNQFLTTLQDPENYSWLYLSTAKNLFQSFWARFGWNQIRLASAWYWSLAVFALIGAAAFVWQLARSWPARDVGWRSVMVWLLISAAVIWLQVFTRPIAPFWDRPLFIPGARYAFPAIIPSMLVFVGGWLAVFRALRTPRFGLLGMFSFLIVLDLVSILTIIDFYA